MKTIYFSFLICTGVFISAQPVIPASHGSQLGTLTYSHADGTTLANLVPGPSGANQTWDFSQYTSAGTTSQTTYNCPGNVNCSDFPVANMLIGIAGSDSYSYMLFSNNEISTVGSKVVDQNNNVAKQIFDNYKLDQKYPITYQQTFSDSWSSHSDPAGNTETGTQTITVDGYGALITPAGTFSNTLRIKRVQNITTNVTGSPTMTVVSESYMWLSPNYKGTLLLISFNNITLAGFPTNQTRSFTYGNNGQLSTMDLDASEDAHADIFPNPSSDYINLKTRESVVKAEISNMEGKIVWESLKTDKINISHLSTGSYILKAELKNGKSIVKKFLKK
ncbi:T9SS type A sorting domain-containing protein [Chryseobacterium sp. MIQD13]|uniref:T9SS type A sorting domain-containing protein n=1 Tax=Chryseobacterium sp. MIQD13 TaxID=3422310 RepID=UPI003D28F847